MELANPPKAESGAPQYEAVCYQCHYRGASLQTGPRDVGCPNCAFPLITATGFSQTATLSLSMSRSALLPGVEPTPPPPEGFAHAALAPTQTSSRWSTAALFVFAVALGIVAKLMQTAL